MTAALALSLLAAVASAAFGAMALVAGADQRPNRLAAAVAFGTAWWASCELLWNAAPSAATALWLHRLASPGFVFLAPLALQLSVEVNERRAPRLERVLPLLYAIDALFAVACWRGHWMLADMVRTPWGWGLVPGPLFPLWVALTAAALALAVAHWSATTKVSRSSAGRALGPFLTWGIALPASLAVATDGLLPLLGVQVPRLATLCLAGCSGLAYWGLSRYGYSRLSGQAFSNRIFRVLPDGVALLSLNGRIRLANRRLAELLGCSVAEAVGRSLAPHLEPPGAPLLDPPRELRELETEWRPAVGPPIPVSLSTTRLLDRSGDTVGLIVVLHDLREVAALRKHLITSGRLAAVGQLAAGIAHEINNPLAFAGANLRQLRREWEAFQSAWKGRGERAVEPPEEWEDLLDEALDGVERAVAIVRDVREFSHLGGGRREPADLNRLLDQAIRVGGTQLPPGARIETHYAELPPVPCDAQRLKQVFLNLVVNAAHAVEEGGRIRVATGTAGGAALVSVEDDGCGMPPDVVERIFDPFFTTKGVGAGTGLGLSIAHEIVRSHRGRIWCESVPGRGTAFHVQLPLEAPL